MRVTVVGAGNVGRSIAKELIANGHFVMLIDRDPKSIKIDSVPEAQWLLADACEISNLEEAHLNMADVLVAATGDDKANLVVSLLSKTEYGVPRVVARVNHPKNEWMFNEAWGVDVAVSTPRLMSALVEEAVAVGDLVRLLTLRQGEANIVEITLPEHAPCIGKRVRDVTFPTDAHLVTILRDAHVLVPSPDHTFESGDELLFVARAEAEPALQECLAPHHGV
jgi:trk system potassium uptake protein TrkA